jgi:hypothetical protein
MPTEVRGLLENPRWTNPARVQKHGVEDSQTTLLDSPVAVNKQVKVQRFLSIAAEWSLRKRLNAVHGRRRMKA